MLLITRVDPNSPDPSIKTDSLKDWELQLFEYEQFVKEGRHEC